ncbi:MAG: hypothetical protein R3Y26_06685 [Rikenellaceae bacterium]
MKRIKYFLAAATFCAATVVGYNAYNNATMTEEERLMKANIEALSNDDEQLEDYDSYCKKLCYSMLSYYCILESSTAYTYCMDRYPFF